MTDIAVTARGAWPWADARLLARLVQGDSFVATTADCHTDDTHSWAFPAGYVRGQVVVCEMLSENARVLGRLELHIDCPVRAITPCDAVFQLDSRSGDRWKGTYRTVTSSGEIVLHATGRTTTDPDKAQIVFDVQGLDGDIPSGDVWNGTALSDNVVGRIASSMTDSAGRCKTTMTTVC